MRPKTYALGGVWIQVEGNDPRLSLKLGQQLQTLFNLHPVDSPPQRPAIYLSFKSTSQTSSPPLSATTVSHSGPLKVWRTAAGFFLQCGDSGLDLDLTGSVGRGMLEPRFWDHDLSRQREFFMLTLLMLLRRHAVYGLHGNGLAQAERGCLIVGASGQGKTTLSLSLIQAGWKFVADDALLLRPTASGVEALALRRGFSCTPHTTAHFPRFRPIAAESPGLADGKRLITIEHLYPDQFQPDCIPRLLLFPCIRNEVDSRLIPLDESEALIALMKQSPGLMVDKSMVSRHLDILKQLIHQARSYQLQAGRDVYQNPTAVSELLLQSLS